MAGTPDPGQSVFAGTSQVFWHSFWGSHGVLEKLRMRGFLGENYSDKNMCKIENVGKTKLLYALTE